VCWNRAPGKPVMYMSIATGIAIPSILLGVTLRYSGFTYELGPTCFIAQQHSFAVFWGWLVGFTVAAFLVQLVTSAYCVHVYVMCHSMRHGSASSGESTIASLRSWGQGNPEESKEEAKARARYIRNRRRDRWRGIHKILLLQWRIISLTVALVIQCLYFSSLTWAQQIKQSTSPSNPKALVFGECLYITQGNRDKCLPLADSLVINKSATLAGLGVMAVSIRP
jgi:hypothetical protein